MLESGEWSVISGRDATHHSPLSTHHYPPTPLRLLRPLRLKITAPISVTSACSVGHSKGRLQREPGLWYNFRRVSDEVS